MIQHPPQAVYTAAGVTSDVSYLNAGFSFILTLLIVAVLIRYNEQFNIVERVGQGLAGAAAFLSMFKQLGFARLMLPFNELYQFEWRIAWILVLSGKVWRLEGHIRHNRAAIRQAKRHLADKIRAIP